MKRFLSVVLLSLWSAAGPAHAVEFAIAPAGSTQGLGIDVPVRINDRLVLRLGANAFDASFGEALRGVSWNAELELGVRGGALEYHPNDDGLFVSLGYYYSRNRMRLNAQPTEDVRIGSRIFTPLEVGSLAGKLRYNRFAPFVGIGYDNTFRNRGPWSLAFRAGILFLGHATVTLGADGTLAQDPEFRADLQEEASALEGLFDAFRFYPLISIAVGYRF